MHSIKNNNGDIIYDQSEIEREILTFYGKLVGSAAKRILKVDIEVQREGP